MADAHPALGGVPLVFGGNVFGWTLDRDASFAMLDAAYEAGVRMIDSAEGYSAWVPGNKGGESEAIIGEWMESRGVRKQMLIGTKTGMGGPPYALKPEAVAKALEGSLERMRTDYVDIYYAHRDDKTTPLDEVVSGYHTAIAGGKARSLGVSNYAPDRLAALHAEARRQAATPFTVLQPEYNLIHRQDYEGALQAVAEAHQMAVLPYYALASGFLSGKFRNAADWAGSSRAAALDACVARGGWKVLAAMDAVVAETDATHAQVALAWLLSRPCVAAPIASATKRAQLADIVAAAALRLEPAQLAKLDAALT